MQRVWNIIESDEHFRSYLQVIRRNHVCDKIGKMSNISLTSERENGSKEKSEMSQVYTLVDSSPEKEGKIHVRDMVMVQYKS